MLDFIPKVTRMVLLKSKGADDNSHRVYYRKRMVVLIMTDQRVAGVTRHCRNENCSIGRTVLEGAVFQRSAPYDNRSQHSGHRPALVMI